MSKELILLTGKASHISITSSTSGSINKGSGSVSTTHMTSFRLNSKPVVFSGTPNLVDGEDVTVAGHDGAEFTALALQNNSTRVIYDMRNTAYAFYFGGGLLSLTGLGLLAMSLNDPLFGMIGHIFFSLILAGGLYLTTRGRIYIAARDLLRGTVSPTRAF